MATFSYVAIDEAGKRTKGIIDANDENDAFAAVRAEKLTPLKVKKQTMMNKEIDISFGPKVKPRDLSVFCRQCVSMLNAGVTLVDTLDMLSEQSENKYMKQALAEVRDTIQQGESFSDALKMRTDVFPKMMIYMVEAGEASGSLEIALDRMATQFEKDVKLKGMIKKAMVYPVIVIIVAIAVVIVMLTMVVPSFMSMFDDLDMEMPKITLAVVAASDFMQAKWYIVVGIIVVIVVAFKAFKSSPGGEMFMARLGLKIPAFQNFISKTNASKLARTLSTMLAAGVPLVQALEITANTMSNVLYKKAVAEAKDDVMKGVPLTMPLERSGIFPPMVIHMTKIGEETGKMEEMLEKMADYYDEEVEVATQALLTAMEPVIIMCLAGVVVVILAAVLSPMLSLYTNLGDSV